MAVEIFDRKSGKILRGANAVQIRDLAKVLRDHPEYEAIVPPSEFISSDRREPPSYREGRSAPSIRVSATIVPQLAHQSLKEGAAVKVTGGQYRGFSGTIRHRLPGSWCLIDGIAKAGGTAIPVIVSASHLAVVQMDVAKKTRVAGIKAHLPDCNDEGPSVKETFQSCLSDITGNRIGTLNQQVLALAKDQCQLEDQLRRTLDSSSVTMNPEDLARERHRLQKRLDYVKSCRQQAEKEVNVAQSTARAHQRHLASES
uniref:BRK domain-containing protein n=1 Tax=Cyclophora tenuis TaxID=216820 RepID=A0A7S1CZX9_CYCTE